MTKNCCLLLLSCTDERTATGRVKRKQITMISRRLLNWHPACSCSDNLWGSMSLRLQCHFIFKFTFGYVDKWRSYFVHRKATVGHTKTTICLCNDEILKWTVQCLGEKVRVFQHSGQLPYILESNLHPFYGFRGLKNQIQITIVCGLDSRSRAGFWKNDGTAVRAVKRIK